MSWWLGYTHMLVWLDRVWPGTSAQHGRDLYRHYNRATCLMMRSSWSCYRSRREYSRRVAAINLRCSVVQCCAVKLVMELQISVAYFDSVKSMTCPLPSCTRNLLSMSYHSPTPLVSGVSLYQLHNKARNARKVILNLWRLGARNVSTSSSSSIKNMISY